MVGCHVELEYSGQTGAPLIDEYTKKVKLEWLRFVALLNESRSAALFPTVLSVDDTRGLAFVVGRDSISVPIVEEVVQSLHQELGSTSTSTTSLAPLFPNYPQSNFVALLSLIKSMLSKLSLAESRTFEATLLNRIRIPFTTDIEDISLTLFEQTLEPSLSQETLSQVLEGLRGFIEPSKTIESFCQLLLASPSSSSTSSDPRVGSTDLSNAILTDLLTTSIRARYDLAKGIVLVLIAAWGASDEEGTEPPMASFEQTTSLAFSTLHSISTLQWTATQVAHPTFDAVESVRKVSTKEEGDDFFEEKFGALKMGGGGGGAGAEVLPVPTYSLLNALLRIPSYSPTVTASTHAAIPTSLANAASTFLSESQLLVPSPLIHSTEADVRFANSLVKLGLYEQAKELIRGYPKVAGMAYVDGRADLEIGDGEGATKNFERAAAGLCKQSLSSSVYLVTPLTVPYPCL